MTFLNFNKIRRRRFLQTVGSLTAAFAGGSFARAEDLPKNTHPRAIFGDHVEPDWKQCVQMTVGPKTADLVGTTDRVIQAAVDYVARLDGGTVRILPGTYRLRNSIFLHSKVRLLGSGAHSVLFKEPSVTTKLMVDGDHWDQEVTLTDPKGFQVGDGVRLVSKDPYGKGTNQGVYFCWGAQHGLYEKNVIEDCTYGMTLGHSDSDNLIRDNDIRRSREGGIYFRGGNKAFAPHRNRFERNRIVDSGGEKGVAIDINGETESVRVSQNELRETRGPASRIGIRIGAETRDIRCEDNQIEGFATPIADLHKT